MAKMSKMEEFYNNFIDNFFACLKNRYMDEYEKKITFQIKYKSKYKNFLELDFNISTIPDWRFGLWLTKEKDSIGYDFFTQYTETIDKFRPSRSEICVSGKIDLKGAMEVKDIYIDMQIIDTIHFIESEPYLAFSRDYKGWDYNTEYHTREEAKEVFDRYLTSKTNQEKWEPICEQIVIDYVKNNVMPYLVGFTLVYHGENYSPKYDIIGSYKLFENGTENDCGCYDIKDFIEDGGADPDKIMNGWEYAEKEAENIANKHGVYLSSWLFNKTVNIVKDVNKYCKFLKFKKVEL